MDTPVAVRRTRFVDHLCILSERQRAHLLGIEDDAELSALKTSALDRQYFEVAASVAAEIKRRQNEVRVDGSGH